jgi:dephospho-CoA kinase
LQAKGAAQTIAVTGGIGSGKSRVCRYLADICQLPVVDLDRICRQLLQPGGRGWQALKEHIDERFFDPAGDLDRAAFRSALFADNELRSRVDGLIHPLARQEMTAQVTSISGPVLVEIPLLFEAGWNEDVDLIVVVYADSSVCCRRIVERDHVTVAQAMQAISAQHCLVEKALLADHVIDNSFSWQATCLQIRQLADYLGCR